MVTKKRIIAAAMCLMLLGGTTVAYAGGDEKTKNANSLNFEQLKKEVQGIVKPLALKAKSQHMMWVVFTIDENRQLQLLDHSAELKPLSVELKKAINNKLVTAGSFYSDTPYTLWVNVREI